VNRAGPEKPQGGGPCEVARDAADARVTRGGRCGRAPAHAAARCYGYFVEVDRARETIATQRPRQLRLGELLHELGAREEPDPPAAGPAASAVRPTPLADGSGSQRRDHLTVGELVELASEAGFGFLIGILSLIAIPFFGLSTPFGLAIALIGAQLVIGRSRPWLPARARRRALSMSMLDRVATILERRTRWLARSTPRCRCRSPARTWCS
jgi:hypothetical protein